MMRHAISRKNLWDATPKSAKRLIGGLLSLLPTPVVLGRRFRKAARFARKAQWWDAEQIAEYQIDELRRILCLANDKSVFYRRWFESVGFHPEKLTSLDDFRALPLLDKKIVRQNTQEMCTVDPNSISVDYGSTGGTSGKPLEFYLPANRSATEYAYLTTAWLRAGVDVGTTFAVLRGRVSGRDHEGLHHDYDPLLHHHYYSSFHMTDENMGRYLEHMATIGPCSLHAYPSTVAAMARFIRRTGVKPPSNIRGVIAESEIVYAEGRQMVEEVFGCRYFSCYGQSEKVVLAAECEHSANYHVWPTYGYFELLDEEGQPVRTPGQRGEIVGTSFINTVMPFVRYRTDDYATYVGDRCEACGREHPIISDIRGHRVQEVLVATDGSEIPWVAMNMHDNTFDCVRQFQFYQDVPGKATLKLAVADGFNEQSITRIRSNLGLKLEDRLELEFMIVDSIPLSPRGKATFVDQRIPTASRAEPPDEVGGSGATL